MARFRDAEGRPITAESAVRAATSAPDAIGQSVSRAGEIAEAAPDPVVGWVVVVDGPGKGSTITLGYGENDIGRGATSRVRLDFGDEEIGNLSHAVIAYDPFGRRFALFCQRDGFTVTLDGEIVSGERELAGGETMGLGGTKLRFVPLCGPHFAWD